jgi:2-polyprenyl-3-methyl-5-hydroxy-6-metoxy-1,4-benzoquinol methylase
MGFFKDTINYSKRKLFKYSQERLDYQFKNNKWDWLASLDELPRYSILVGWHEYHNPGGSILDLGCGQGILLKKFPNHSFSKYTAIDFSLEAVKQINQDSKVEAFEADITKYVPTQKYDSIIFNESLYYVKNPITHLKNYFNYLNDNGYIFLSIHLKKNSDLVIEIKNNFQISNENIVENRWGEKWSCLSIKKS